MHERMRDRVEGWEEKRLWKEDKEGVVENEFGGRIKEEERKGGGIVRTGKWGTLAMRIAEMELTQIRGRWHGREGEGNGKNKRRGRRVE